MRGWGLGRHWVSQLLALQGPGTLPGRVPLAAPTICLVSLFFLLLLLLVLIPFFPF